MGIPIINGTLWWFPGECGVVYVINLIMLTSQFYGLSVSPKEDQVLQARRIGIFVITTVVSNRSVHPDVLMLCWDPCTILGKWVAPV